MKTVGSTVEIILLRSSANDIAGMPEGTMYDEIERNVVSVVLFNDISKKSRSQTSIFAQSSAVLLE